MPKGYPKSGFRTMPSAEQRFWPNVDKSGECWIWTRGRNEEGYGRITAVRRAPAVYVHRFSWELANGPIPADMQVVQTCGCRQCVRPDHLALLARADIKPPSRTAEERFWSHVDKSADCWLWTAYRDKNGYGAFRVTNTGQGFQAHRFAWMLTVGEIPEGMCVCHSCDTPPCVNPSHLWLGTNADNNADMMRKGRGRFVGGDQHWTRTRPERRTWGERNGAFTHPERVPRGSANHHARLTEPEVLEIRRLYAEGAH